MSMAAYHIEKDIPLPTDEEAKMLETIRKMQPGDSVIIDDSDEAFQFYMAALCRGTGVFEKRRDTVGRTRIWRTS